MDFVAIVSLLTDFCNAVIANFHFLVREVSFEEKRNVDLGDFLLIRNYFRGDKSFSDFV